MSDTEQQGGGQESTLVTVDPAIEAEAASNGWVPEEDFRGDKADWVDAATFVKRGREINPILRKTNERLRAEITAQTSRIQELELTTKEFKEEFSKMRENAYKRAMNDLKTQRREALKADDHETADMIEEQLDEMKEAAAKKPAPPRQAPAPAPDMKLFNDWVSDNSWYDAQKNPDLTDMADAVGLRLKKSRPDLYGRDFLDEISREVRKKFPDKFTNPNRSAPSTVSSTQSRGASSGKRGYADLPADAKAACDRFVKQKILTKDQYVEDFFAGEQ